MCERTFKNLADGVRKCIDEKGIINLSKLLTDIRFLKSSCLMEFAEFSLKAFPTFGMIAGIGRKGGFLGSCVSAIAKKPFLSVNTRWVIDVREVRYLRAMNKCFSDTNVMMIDDSLTTGETFDRARSLLSKSGYTVLGEAILVWNDVKKSKIIDERLVKPMLRLSDILKQGSG